ncbi:MAG: DUF1858 domain-containing protein [Lachnospiraceae bacterium]|nr:DUF1858 domain-containing protein [Lachnospiraceae bacterium]
MFGFGKKKENESVKDDTEVKKDTQDSGDEKVVITKDMLVTDAMMLNPNLAPVLMEAGMYCFSCPASMGETIEEAAMVHGFDVDDILEAVNKLDKAGADE